MEKRLMNINELSAYVGTSKGSLYTMVCMGKIPVDCIVRMGRSLRFEKTKIDAWLDSNNVGKSRA